MKKPYLLIAGDHYYPVSGTGDWIECFESYEDAYNSITVVEDEPGKGCGQYIINDRTYAWYDIVDLRNWCE
jgi:hypothetical protein